MKKGLIKFAKESKYSLSGFFRHGLMNQYKHALVIGGSNILGNSLISNFQETWRVANIDFEPNKDAHLNLILKKDTDILEYATKLESELETFSKRFDSIICVNSSFAKGSISEQSIFNQYEQLQQEQVLPSLVAGHLACKYMAPNGLLVFTGGSLPFRKTCPNSLAYGITKDTIHSIALNIAEKEELNNDVTIVTILPEIEETLITNEQKSEKTDNGLKDYDKIAQMVKMWSDGRKRPISGSYVLLKNVNNKIVPEYL